MSVCSDTLQLLQVLTALTDTVHGDTITIVVTRRSVMRSVQLAMTKATFVFDRPLRIVFAGEDAEDEGGPKREFFR